MKKIFKYIISILLVLVLSSCSIQDKNPTNGDVNIDLSKNNYMMTLNTTVNNVTTKTVFSYNNQNICREDYYESESIRQYLTYVANEYRYIYPMDKKWFYINDEVENFDLYLAYFEIGNISKLSKEDLEYNDKGYLEPKSGKLRKVCQNILGIYESEQYKTCKIYVEDQLIKKILIESTYISDEITSNYYYELLFSNYDKTIVKIPVSLNEATYIEEENYIRPIIKHSPILDVIGGMGYDEYTKITYGVTRGLPSIGDVDVLVIPVEFTDFKFPKTVKQDLETAFFGSSAETGWESLSSYYQKSSYNKLNIRGTVLEPYDTKKTVNYYDTLQKEYLQDLEDYDNYITDVYPKSVESSIIKGALEYYDDQIDYSKYDSDKNGYIDAIYFIYSCDYNLYDGDSLWWAFTDEYLTDYYEYYDNVEADFYTFMSYQFIFDKLQGKTVKYNAETIIHETGHLLGLDDYYDYDESIGPDGGIGGGDMMDANVGDHNAYSKLMLGWITPYIVTGNELTIDLESFATSGDCVMICKDWNGSFFSEYYIIDFYTPTHLNEFAKGYKGLFSMAGIRIYHVDATLSEPRECFSVFDLTKYNNSYSTHKVLSLVEADGRNDISYNRLSQNSDLFKENSIYSNAKWYDGQAANFTVKVNKITSTSANITISFLLS